MKKSIRAPIQPCALSGFCNLGSKRAFPRSDTDAVPQASLRAVGPVELEARAKLVLEPQVFELKPLLLGQFSHRFIA